MRPFLPSSNTCCTFLHFPPSRCSYRYLLLSYQPIKHRPLSHNPRAALQRTLQHLQQDGADIRTFLSIWFHGAPVDTITRGNVKDLIAYAFW
jgi:hypothetical protein